MDKQEITDLRGEAWKYWEFLTQAIKNDKKLSVIIGRTLNDINEKKLYKYMFDGGCDTFKDFLENQEISTGIPPATARVYMRLYQFYVVKNNLSEGELEGAGVRRLSMMMSRLKEKSEEEVKRIVETITPLTHRDYVAMVREEKLEPNKPSLYFDRESGQYILDFDDGQMLRIYDRTNNKIIYGKPFDSNLS